MNHQKFFETLGNHNITLQYCNDVRTVSVEELYRMFEGKYRHENMDENEIVGIVQYGEHPVIATRRSLYRLVDNQPHEIKLTWREHLVSLSQDKEQTNDKRD